MQGTPKAIEIKGIVRNATVIGAQDGQAEDLINLRFMDGSWRASGDGRLINFTMGAEYSQLYVHTNVYHHLLGVNNGTLYWFAEIGTDGVSFYPLDDTTSRTNWPEDMQSLPTSPVALTTVVGDIWITQTGHLLTIIDQNDGFEHLVFKTGEKAYVEVKVDVNGKTTDRKLFPFGQIHFNCHCPFDSDHVYSGKDLDVIYNFGIEVYYDTIKALIKKKNQFAQPFIVIAAIRLYDGSYAYASNPIYIHPREKFNNYQNEGKGYINISSYITDAGVDMTEEVVKSNVLVIEDNATFDRYNNGDDVTVGVEKLNKINNAQFPLIIPYGTGNEDAGKITFSDSFEPNGDHVEGGFLNYVVASNSHYFWALGSDLFVSIDSDMINMIKANEDIFSSFCIFVTTEADLYKAREKEYNESNITHPKGTLEWSQKKEVNYKYHSGSSVTTNMNFYSYAPQLRESLQIINVLKNSPFFLLREYKINELGDLLENPIIDLSGPEYEGLLENIVQQNRLTTEALSRTTYLPKVSYMYNGRLHIANYKSYPFFGYPIDLFHLHNHSVKVQANSWFKDVLPNLADNNDTYLQYAKTVYNFNDSTPSGLQYFAYIKVTIDSSQGEQVVVRYIPLYEISDGHTGRVDFIEALNPLLTYPDARAKSMDIVVYQSYNMSAISGHYRVYQKKNIQLKPHPYLNMAYYIDPELKPITLTSQGTNYSSILEVPEMVNTEEYFPNGLKVSKTDNPMFFPVENAYQVGSAEILALMSNTIAVGTGQTGAAPLYVFCKDGVYALFVDASGQMTYSNSRVLARDVCNNPRSVTPIDAGVVFTTNRGLMMIAGEQIEEIGQPAEGDVLHYTNVNAQGQPLSVEGSKIATDALTKIAGLPSSLCNTTDFLTYLQGAIVNYNHNMRELMVSNPNYPYSYVLDREGNWSRRDYTAAEYVNNYPTSYRVAVETVNNQQVRRFYKLDDEGDANTTLEHRKEADNKIFYLSNVIKLDSIGFKQAYRFVVRGYFEGIPFAEGTLGSTDVYVKDAAGSTSTVKAKNIGDTISLQYRNAWGNARWINTTSGFPANIRIINKATGEDVTDTIVTADPDTTYTFTRKSTEIGIVVEGSYDGIKFAPLGFNRKSGKFTNIGCHVSHTDVRFYRVILAGQVTGKTRIDYMEMSADGSVLNTKIR